MRPHDGGSAPLFGAREAWQVHVFEQSPPCLWCWVVGDGHADFVQHGTPPRQPLGSSRVHVVGAHQVLDGALVDVLGMNAPERTVLQALAQGAVGERRDNGNAASESRHTLLVHRRQIDAPGAAGVERMATPCIEASVVDVVIAGEFRNGVVHRQQRAGCADCGVPTVRPIDCSTASSSCRAAFSAASRQAVIRPWKAVRGHGDAAHGRGAGAALAAAGGRLAGGLRGQPPTTSSFCRRSSTPMSRNTSPA